MTEPAAWRASSPVSNLMVRVPNLPLSITVSTAEMIGFRHGQSPCLSRSRSDPADARARDLEPGESRPVFDRGPRARHESGDPESHYRGPGRAFAGRSW